MKTSFRKIFAFPGAVIALVILVTFPLEGKAAESTFTITYTNDVPYLRSVTLGEQGVARIAEHILIARNDAEKGFMHNTAALCIVLFVDDQEKARKGDGYCTFRDEDGDEIYEHYDYATASSGRVEVFGGTGKYAGVTCGGEWKRLAAPKPPVEGKWQNIGSKTITCQMP